MPNLVTEKFGEDFFINQDDIKPLLDLARGGYGSIALVRHKKLNRLFAAKTIIAGRDKNWQTKFIWEAQKMFECRDQYILNIFGLCINDSVPDEPVYSLILPYCKYGSIRKVYESLDKDSIPICLKYRWLCEIVHGLKYLHFKKIIHMDMKISNVLVTDELHAQLCDFGVSRWKMPTADDEHKKKLAGTVTHLPPEILNNYKTPPSETSDVYGLAILIWELLSEEEPYRAEQNEDLIQAKVINGCRPDEALLAQCQTAQTARHMMELMKECWNSNPQNRPDCQGISRHLEKHREAMENEAKQIILSITQLLDTAKVEDETESARRQLENLTMAEVMESNREHYSKNVPQPAVNGQPPAVNGQPPVVNGQQPAVNGQPPAVNGQARVHHVVINAADNVNFGSIGEDEELEFDQNPDPKAHGYNLPDMYSTTSQALRLQLAQRIGKRWKDMARCFHMHEGDIDSIDHDHHFYGLTEKCYEMLQKWHQKYGSSATREWLASALIYVRKDELIDNYMLV